MRFLRSFFSTEMVTEEERRIIKNVQGRTTKSVRWLPLAWSVNLIQELRSKKFIGTNFTDLMATLPIIINDFLRTIHMLQMTRVMRNF